MYSSQRPEDENKSNVEPQTGNVGIDMVLSEIRRFVKLTESLDDKTSVNIDFCGYTSDDESIESIDIRTDGESEWIDLGIEGQAYSTGYDIGSMPDNAILNDN